MLEELCALIVVSGVVGWVCGSSGVCSMGDGGSGATGLTGLAS